LKKQFFEHEKNKILEIFLPRAGGDFSCIGHNATLSVSKVAFFASLESVYITGVNLGINEGQ
jgi:hypothetical protein